jgi:hypothetical protein
VLTAGTRNTGLLPPGRISLSIRLRPAARAVLRRARSVRLVITATGVAGSRSWRFHKVLRLRR